MTASAELVVTTPRGPSLPEKIEYARHLAESGLLPASFRKQPANVLYAVEYGDMLGLSPMAAITGIHVIDGKPTASAALMSALVRVKGHKLRVVFDKVAMAAHAELTRVDDPTFTYRVDWDLNRAVTAGLCTIKNGQAYARDTKGRPTPWEKYTPNMLKWRCISEVCRDGAEECLMGMHYTPEELGVEIDEDGVPLQVVAERLPDRGTPTPLPAPDWAARITEYETAGDLTALGDLWKMARHREPDNEELRQRITQAAERVKATVAGSADVSDLSASDIDGELVEPEPEPTITEKQSKRLHALCTNGGLNRDTKLAALSHITGREITTSADLTVAEAEAVNEKLSELARGGVSLIEAVVELIDRPAGGAS